jgi:iron complex outermembrane receptor protein/hemoglobin/transferrin/lactoferrin receptor protein
MHRTILRNSLALALALAAGLARADEPDTFRITDDPAAYVAQNEDPLPEGTLPPVEVRPEPDAPAPALDNQGGDFGDPFDLPDTFPSLSQQIFNDVGGISRGIPRSIFDDDRNATIIDRETIREKQAATVMQALQYEPSILVQQTGRGQLSPFIRGMTGQQILVMVDGVRVNTSILRSGPNQYTALFDPGSIERIEVVRGSQSVQWGGDALGGVINIITRGASYQRGDYTGGNFIQYLSSADDGTYSRGSVEGWVGKHGVFTGGSYLDNDNLDRGGGLGPQPGTEYSQYAADIKYNYIIGDDDMITVLFQHFEQEDVPRSDRFAPFVQQNNPNAKPRPTYFDPQQRDLLYLRMHGNGYNAFYDSYAQTVSWQRNKEGNQELSGTQLTVGEFDVSTFGYTLTLTKDLDQFGILSYGGDYYYDNIDASRERRANPNAPFVPRDPAYPDDSRYDRAGGYASWDLQATQRLNVNAGVRFENINAHATPNVVIDGTPTLYTFDRTYQDWIGSVGFVYEVDPVVNFVGGVYEGFRAPNIDDLTADKTFLQNAVTVPTLGGLNVQPEHSLTYEVGLKLDAPRLRGQVYQWYTNLDDYITRFADANNVVVYGNGDAQLHGTELAGEFLLDPQWSLYGNAWYTWGRDTRNGGPYPRIPPTQGVLGLRWRAEDRLAYADLFTWMVADFDADRYTNFNDARFPTNGQPGYATLNLRLGRTFGQHENHRVSLSLMNMTDKYYRVVGSGVDGEGFNAILGYEFLQ